jgi:hypothetical protein
MRGLKTGISSFPSSISGPLAAVVEALKKVGLFLVPLVSLSSG